MVTLLTGIFVFLEASPNKLGQYLQLPEWEMFDVCLMTRKKRLDGGNPKRDDKSMTLTTRMSQEVRINGQ